MFRILTIIGKFLCLRNPFFVPVIFSLTFFFVQLTQISAYGASWDEPLHRNWGKIFTYFWKIGDRRLLELMPGHGIEYGPLYFTSNYLVSEFLYNNGFLTFVSANHIVTLVVSSFAIGLTYQLGKMIGGRVIGVLSVIFLVCFPQFIAHAHYNPKDIPLMTAVLLTAIIFVAGIRKKSSVLLIVSAFLFGFSTSIKINALLMAPVFGAVYILSLFLVSGRSFHTFTLQIRKQFSTIAAAIVGCITGLYLFWPSAWGDVFLIPRSVAFFLGKNFWPGKVLFFGAEYSGADLPFYYIPFEFGVSMPLLMLVTFFVGLLCIIRSFYFQPQKIEYFLLVLWILFPLFFSMKPGLVRYDGMRQFFILLPAVAVVSAFGLHALYALLLKKTKKPYVVGIFLILVFTSLASQVVSLHPFEGSYRNELLQIAYPKDIDESFQIEYWGAIYKQGMDWLTENATPYPIICVPTAGILVIWYPWRDDFTFECSEKTDYVMFFTRYSEARAYRDLKNPVFSIRRMNSTLLLIYKIK